MLLYNSISFVDKGWNNTKKLLPKDLQHFCSALQSLYDINTTMKKQIRQARTR
jgi:hypothetical protein